MDQKKPRSGIRDLSHRRDLERKAGGPAKRWEDDLNEFVKDEETQNAQSNYLKNNKTWLPAAKRFLNGEKKEKQYTKHVIDD